MTNVQDPTNQAKILFDKYTNNGWLDGELTFIIPVYKNMPTAIKKPSNLQVEIYITLVQVITQLDLDQDQEQDIQV